MKLTRLTLLGIVVFFCSTVLAQNNFSISFRNGALRPDTNIRQSFVDSFNKRAVRVNNKSLVVLQFEKLPNESARKILSANGIELLEYISGNAYTATVRGPLKAVGLQQAQARSIVELAPQQKMNVYFAQGKIPSWALKAAGTVDVWVSFPKTFSVNEVLDQLRQQNIEVLSLSHQSYRILALRIAQNRLTELAALPFIEYVQPAPPGDQPLNFNSRDGSRASVLNASIANGGKGLNGEGVVVGIGDNADVQTHIDFAGRLINRAPAATAAAHGQHVSGTVSGAGNILEQYRGYAPKATIVTQAFSGILANAATYVQDYDMVITNNSYGDIIECDYHGTYDLISRILDQMAFDFPYLENVFAAGNSGASTCSPFALGYRTVLGGYQSAKNVLTVGATNDLGAIASFSSRGPVKDGRTKPEIVAMGQGVASTWPTNTYAYNNGTSMAAPAASGGLALLYQRYRQLNGGANPKNGLMKALLCNGASDRGNTGPDYQYGFGWMNLLHSVEILENNQYFIGSSTPGSTNTHTITVPANTAQLKIMLYWNDPAASLMSTKALVNDLDLRVTDPSSSSQLPRVLDTAIANVSKVATTGADHLNNMEQVIIDNPSSGTYIINVAGTAIAQNPSQEYFVVYDVVPVQLKITAPAGGVGLVPAEQAKINWEAAGYPTGTATLEFSSNNGATWSTIAAGLAINSCVYTWTVPNVATEQALVRITKEGSGESSTSNLFTIVGTPAVSLDPVQCEGYINLKWAAVSGATDYEVMMLQGDEMKTVSATTATSYTFSGLIKDSTYWVTVRARINGREGRRAVAIPRQPNTGTCAGAISNNDLRVDAILSPKSGRKFTSTALTSSAVVSVRIKNLDDAPVSSFDVKYSINGGAWVVENVTTPIAAGGVYTHDFATTADLSTTGTYNLVAVVKNTAADPVAANDTAVVVVKQIDNQPLNLGSYFVDDMETAAVTTYQRDTVGFKGIERYDFTPSTAFGRARTFFNSGIAYSGSKAITIDADRLYAPGNINYLYGTFNLGNYTASTNDLRLDFQFLNHSQVNNTSNKVWIRGNDTQPWIEVYDLNNNANAPGRYKQTESIELSDLLANAGQNFGSSFQVRWGQYGQLPATDKTLAAGYTFDDIRIYEVLNDLQMKSIDEPITKSCGLTNASVVKISVRNSANTTITNVPVRYRINGGSWISETIPSIAGNATIQYTFAGTSNLSAFDFYTVQAIVDLTNDSFRDNDTMSVVVRNLPVISSFPYLQSFEANDGYWYADGSRSTWDYGTPTSNRINRAASGSKAWKTNLQGHYNDGEFSYLYSPCFDLTGMAAPTLSFSVAMDIEDCGSTICDAAWMEYSADGITWTKLIPSAGGTNWYNKAASQVWSDQNGYYWHVATTDLPAGLSRLRLRFMLYADGGVTREGLAIDDVHIYDKIKGIYDGVTMTSPVMQNVSGNNWIDFTSGGKLIASVQPNNQDLGSTSVQAYIFDGPVRNSSKQYYHNRNITIKPATRSLSDSVTVRFYFLDSETNSLINATGCTTCDKPSSAYELGISKYTDPDLFYENGSVGDNQQGLWSFIQPDKVAKVPFDKGYYAEFKVKDFSEFWLNTGGFERNTPLPVKMMEFTAQKAGIDVLVSWKTGSETNVDRYEIEVARGNAELQASRFTKIGTVVSRGNTTSVRNYNFTDSETEKFGPRYYRLKITDIDGSFTYSPIRPVVFDEAILWQVYPNPSQGNFYMIYQLNKNERVEAKVYDISGKLVKESQAVANGFAQKLSIDLSTGKFASGIYVLKIKAGNKEQFFKLHKL
jgi:hypothetical protein